MVDNHSLDWNKEALRALRLRMGWSRSDLARRLHCSSEEVDSWEEGISNIEANIKNELELILRQAEECCDEVMYTPAAENECAKQALAQIDFSRVKLDLE
ncbi:helix-turn-helix domain-containing protein [Bdellovibrio sp. BCCA]|uniref:helix-turn-helix domain-containing protein n=1 Tax=Bdellovibrio sp. BCCA TaxID=3136281 RepID=UPI0030F14C2A